MAATPSWTAPTRSSTWPATVGLKRVSLRRPAGGRVPPVALAVPLRRAPRTWRPSGRSTEDAAALVDISQAGKSGAAVLSSFNARVRRNPAMVLVAPHTHALQEFFGQVALAGQGEEAQATYRDANRPDRPRWGGEPDPLDYTSLGACAC